MRTFVKWLGVASIASLLAIGTAQARDWNTIKASGTMIVATEGAFAPFNYYEGTKLTGFEVDIAEAITYIVYVKGVNMADNPDDIIQKYWRPALGAHYPNINSGYSELHITSANANRWQMLRASSAGVRDGSKIWLTFESWYPAWYGQWLGGQTSWMVFENLTIEYTPAHPVDTTPPGVVASFMAAAASLNLLFTSS